ncbi:hypothetical protein [Bosea beijingensis]|uniref:hypothetical protein n=1 Tax=Bosea beijingensis TaxID=3068632 RepID=UPI0027419CE4|nr:hypothetical protein [Bosea sp. REN20]
MTMVGFLTLAQHANAADRRPSLCKRDEVAIFSCSLGRKVVSLCASPDLTETAGTMSYRFGRKGAIELEYPAAPVHPRTAFTAGIDSAERGDFVRFSKGEFTYTLYALVGLRERREEDGLSIARGAKVVRNLKCADFAMGETAWQLMYRAKLPADPSQSIAPQ